MRLEDLQLVFRSSTSAPSEARAYVVNLLNKFEVALTWDSRTLLIPSLLPTEDQTAYGLPGSDVRVKVKNNVLFIHRMASETVVELSSVDRFQFVPEVELCDQRKAQDSIGQYRCHLDLVLLLM